MNYIKEFWNWFSENCQKFDNDFENTDLLYELDKRINELGEFSWEIGPGITSPNSLVISPGGNIDLLPCTKEIIGQSQPCLGWEYYYAKPPKEWDLLFDFETRDGLKVHVDASLWEYVLLRYEDGMFEIIIEVTNIGELNENDKLAIVEILLDGVIGEELRMTRICLIDVVEEFENEYGNKASNIKYLLKHINSLL